MKLTDEQEEQVQNSVDAYRLNLKTLRDDVLDHLCCVIEYELGKGKSFDHALQKAMNELAPNGLQELEHTTLFLLNSKRIILMKKAMYLIGFLGSVSLASGYTVKLLHWPGATEMIIAGSFTLLLVFIPLLVFDRYKVAISKALSERLKLVFGAVAAITTGLSGIFKLLHLQGATTLLLVGSIVFAFGFLPFLFFTMYKKSVS